MPRLIVTCCTLAMLSLSGALVTHVAAQESGQWPQFRGPAFNPTADNPNLPERWSTEENVEWAVPIDGRGWSSPIVVNDKVFLTTAVATDGQMKPVQSGTNYSNEYVAELQSQGLSEEEIEKKVMERDFQLPDEVTLDYFLICLDLNTGKELWRGKFYTGHPPGGSHRKNSFASETPTTDGQRVFVYIGNLGVWAYDLDGNQQWNHDLDAQKIYMEFGTGTSPVLCDGRLIILHDNEEAGFIAALDTETGKELWRTEREVSDKAPGKSAWGTPYVWRNSNRTEIVTLQPGAAVSYDVNGKQLWRLDGCSAAPAASSFAIGDTLYLNGGAGRPFFAIKPGASGSLKVAGPGQDAEPQTADWLLWQQPRSGTYIPTPVIYDDGLYIVQDNGIMKRLTIKDGEESFRARIKERGADFTTSPWAYNGKIFCLSEQGDTYVLEAGDEFKLLHVNPLGEFSMASPAIVGDRLLIRTEKKLYSIRKSG